MLVGTLPDVEGQGIVRVVWASDVVLVVTAVPVALGADRLGVVAAAVALLCFAASLVVWAMAFFTAAARTTRGDDIVVSSLFLTGDSAPAVVRRRLYWATAVSVIVALATGFRAPFGILVPMLPLGLIGLWGARYGTFPPREVRDGRTRK